MGFFAKAAQQTDIAMAMALIGMVAMLILPLPESLLDLGLVLNLTGAVLILLTALYTTEPLQFSVFPALLLVTTLFRLALEVSAMKLIIGTGSAGHVIATFGQVVIGGNYVVGIIVFLLLVVVQFVVITSGAGRVAEVAARFTLDAMPGKQMAIDADLNAGIINQDQARQRRKTVGQEADFFGAMDGANKFVRGDAIAAIVIIVLNIIGGFAMGLSKGEDIMKVLQNYTLLTVGEGLVAQIPALLISTAAGLMVTRAASDTAMGGDIARQIFASPRPLFITAGLVCPFIPFGFPLPQTMLVAGTLAGIGLVLTRSRNQVLATAQATATAVAARPAPLATPESVLPLLHVDVLELNFGYGLLQLVDQTVGGDLLDRITVIRQKTALELGLVIPTVRIRDDLHLKANDYAVKLKGATVASGTVHPNSIMLIDPGSVIDPITDGIPAKEPAFGVPAQWVSRTHRERAEMAGYTVVDPSSVITTHLAEVIKGHASEIITRQDTSALIDHVKQANGAVVEELIPTLMNGRRGPEGLAAPPAGAHLDPRPRHHPGDSGGQCRAHQGRGYAGRVGAGDSGPLDLPAVCGRGERGAPDPDTRPEPGAAVIRVHHAGHAEYGFGTVSGPAVRPEPGPADGAHDRAGLPAAGPPVHVRPAPAAAPPD